MEGEAGVLQDRIEILAFERRVGDAQERIRGDQDEEVKGRRDPRLHRKRIGLEHERQIGAEHRDQGAEEREDRHPQHHRAFVIAPDAGEPIDQRHLRIRILVDIDHREIRRDVAIAERAERHRDEEELRERRRRRHAHQREIVAARADDRHRALNEGQAQRQHQCVMAEFGNHPVLRLPALARAEYALRARTHHLFALRQASGLLAVIVLPMPRLLQGIGDLLGHIGLVVFGENGVGGEHARAVERAFGDHALPFAEQIRQHALIGDRESRSCRRSLRNARRDYCRAPDCRP